MSVDCLYRLFLVTNEEDSELTIEQLRTAPPAGKTLIATSGFFALNVAAARPHIEQIKIIDKSIAVKHFWDDFRPLINRSSDRLRTIAKINKLINRNKSIYFPRDEEPYSQLSIQNLEKEIQAGVSWLSTDDSFHRIREIFSTPSGFEVLFMSFTIPRQMRELSGRTAIIDTLYLSNVREYADDESRHKEFILGLKTLRPLFAPKTLLIDTVPRHWGTYSQFCLTQRVIEDPGAILDCPVLTDQAFPNTERI